MQRTIQAIYEDGVFKPLHPVSLRSGQRVTISIPDATWEQRFRRVLDRIHRHTAGFPPEEVERDVSVTLSELKGESRRST